MWVIRRTDQGGGWLRRPPLNGWTHRLQDAQTYPDEETARAQCCPENEVPERVDRILGSQ